MTDAKKNENSKAAVAELLGEKLVTVHAAGSGRNWKHI